MIRNLVGSGAPRVLDAELQTEPRSSKPVAAAATPLGPLADLGLWVRKTAIVGAAIVGFAMGPASAQGALLGANPGPPTAGAQLELVAPQAVEAGVEVRSEADQRMLDLLALHLDAGASPHTALRKALYAAQDHAGTPSSGAYLEAERLASAPKAERAAWAQGHLAARAEARGVSAEGLKATLTPLAEHTSRRPDHGSSTLSSELYSIAGDTLDPEGWTAFRNKVMQTEVTSSDLLWIRTGLMANNGEIFTPEQRAQVRAFVEHPSPEFRKLAFDLEQPVMSKSGAKAFLRALQAKDLDPAASRAILVSTLKASTFAPGAAGVLEAEVAAQPLARVLEDVLDGGVIDGATWATRLVPNLVTLPKHWSPEADLLLEARMDPDVEISPEVRLQVDEFLKSRGYPMLLPLPATAAEIRANNVTAPDVGFEALMDAAGRDGSLVMGFVDGGFDLRHPGADAKHATNDAEIPGNQTDDDGNGYFDDHDGLNLTGLVDRQMDYGRKKQGHLRTGMYQGDAHGNHVLGVGTRGSDRIEGALVAASSGQIAEAIDYLVARGATVINFSMGVDPRALDETLAAIDRYPDVLFMHAAGNNGDNLSEKEGGFAEIARHPRPNLVHVAAANEHGARLPDSNFSGDFVQLAAGAKHFSFALTGSTRADAFGADEYHYSGKTSQASPNAGNTASKVRLLAPKLSPKQVAALLMTSSASDARWEGVVKAGGTVDHDHALALAATIGLVQDGLTEKAAVAQLGLDAPVAAYVTAARAELGF